jgi:HAE1 family hydrophobic/amphiphilic exporter-1
MVTSLANAGIVVDAQELGRARPEGKISRTLSSLTTQLDGTGSRHAITCPPRIQGLGASNGFQMQVELTDGDYDFARLQRYG